MLVQIARMTVLSVMIKLPLAVMLGSSVKISKLTSGIFWRTQFFGFLRGCKESVDDKWRNLDCYWSPCLFVRLD